MRRNKNMKVTAKERNKSVIKRQKYVGDGKKKSATEMKGKKIGQDGKKEKQR